MKKVTFTLEHFGDVVGIIITDSENIYQLKEKVELAIKDNVEVDSETTVQIGFGRIGDFGENTNVNVKYVNDGELIEDNEFVLRKIVSY